MKKKGRFIIQEINDEIPDEIKPIINEIKNYKKSLIHHSSIKLKYFKKNIVSDFIESFDNNNLNKINSILIFNHKNKTWIDFNKIFYKKIKIGMDDFEEIFSYNHIFKQENTEEKNTIDNLGYSSSDLSLNNFVTTNQNNNQTNFDIYQRQNIKSLTFNNIINDHKYTEIINHLKHTDFFNQIKNKINYENDDKNNYSNYFENKYFYGEDSDKIKTSKSKSSNKLPKIQKHFFTSVKSFFHKIKIKKIENEQFEIINNKIHKFSILEIQKQFCITIK